MTILAILFLVFGGIALLVVIGLLPPPFTMFPAKCWMCRRYRFRCGKGTTVCIEPHGWPWKRHPRTYPAQYACGWYKRKWWLLWVSREAPGSGG